MTEAEVTLKAYKAISNAKGIPLMMIGHSINMRSQVESDPTMSDIVESTCDRCKDVILSSQIKEKIKELTKDSGQQATLCCLPCMIKEIEKRKPNVIKTMNGNGEISSFKNPGKS